MSVVATLTRVNNTLASFPALNAVKIDLIESSDNGRRINPRRFDYLVEQIEGGIWPHCPR
jgi:hypothetical protein